MFVRAFEFDLAILGKDIERIPNDSQHLVILSDPNKSNWLPLIVTPVSSDW